MFEVIGLNATSEVIYRTICERPAWGVAQLANHLGLPETRVRADLDHLAELHLVTCKSEAGPIKVIDPGIALRSLLLQRETDLINRQRELDAARAAINTLASELSHKEVGESERLDSLVAVRARLRELAASVRESCWSLLPGGPQSSDALESSRPLDKGALDRGISLRTIYQSSCRNDTATRAYVEWLASRGGENRTLPTLPLPLVIVDEKVALVPIDVKESRRGAMSLSSPGAVAVARVLFELLWDTATPWGEHRLDADGLTTQERELLRLLSNGMTDEAAGRALGISLRSVRRLAAGLMVKLNARSRFEAGVRATQNKWL
ncbi:LuxR C-terminal-related transcriptional regulator [Nonomuraea sp. bgisy101]|uniref:LuxR C-terminal-related transcriptional regulator n=1 Tax=Nonomuraea sp. bgisy101 TaxID=3413784 RepID=UPI003D73B924